MLDTVRILSQDAVALPATQYQALDHRSEHKSISNYISLPSLSSWLFLLGLETTSLLCQGSY